MDIAKILDQFMNVTIEYGPKILMAIVAFYVGFKVVGWLSNFVNKLMKSNGVDDTIRPFLSSIVDAGLKLMLIMTVAGMVGIQTTSFVAVLGAMAFAIGMALQGSLGNFASGVMVLLFKPYKVGDLVTLQDHTGVVQEIQIFNTLILTPDNKKIILPNSIVTSGPITNISGQGEIRVDMTFGIGYNDDIDHARMVIQDVANQCPQILKNKPVDIFVNELADSSVNFTVRPWCKSEDYWTVYFFMQEYVKKACDHENINIPYPQMELNVVSEKLTISQN